MEIQVYVFFLNLCRRHFRKRYERGIKLYVTLINGNILAHACSRYSQFAKRNKRSLKKKNGFHHRGSMRNFSLFLHFTDKNHSRISVGGHLGRNPDILLSLVEQLCETANPQDHQNRLTSICQFQTRSLSRRMHFNKNIPTRPTKNFISFFHCFSFPI